MNKDITNNRIQNFDIARSFAILCVVFCHCTEAVYFTTNFSNLSTISQIIRVVFLTIGRLGVPIFLFLTGALTLKKQIETDEDVIKFYKKNLLPLLIAIEIWNIIYNLFSWCLNGKIDINNLLKDILFLKQSNMPHMWYMPMILGMYLAVPFIAKIIKTFSLKTIKIPMIILFIVSFLLPSINIVINIFKLEQYKVILDLSFLGGTYGLYIILGYYMNNGMLRKYNSIVLVITSIISFIITCIVQYFSYKKGIRYDVWYNFATLCICTVCIFGIFLRIKNKENKNIFIRLTEYISKISLGIFFFHEIFLQIFRRYIDILNLRYIFKMILLFGLSFICSIVIIYLFSKVKLIKEKVFLIKG